MNNSNVNPSPLFHNENGAEFIVFPKGIIFSPLKRPKFIPITIQTNIMDGVLTININDQGKRNYQFSSLVAPLSEAEKQAKTLILNKYTDEADILLYVLFITVRAAKFPEEKIIVLRSLLQDKAILDGHNPVVINSIEETVTSHDYSPSIEILGALSYYTLSHNSSSYRGTHIDIQFELDTIEGEFVTPAFSLENRCYVEYNNDDDPLLEFFVGKYFRFYEDEKQVGVSFTAILNHEVTEFNYFTPKSSTDNTDIIAACHIKAVQNFSELNCLPEGEFTTMVGHLFAEYSCYLENEMRPYNEALILKATNKWFHKGLESYPLPRIIM